MNIFENRRLNNSSHSSSERYMFSSDIKDTGQRTKFKNNELSNIFKIYISLQAMEDMEIAWEFPSTNKILRFVGFSSLTSVPCPVAAAGGGSTERDTTHFSRLATRGIK